jgi:hypothetical protein
MLLHREHEDREHELCGEKHLEKYTLGYRGAGTEGGGYIERAREDGGYDSSGGDASEHLGKEAANGSNAVDGSNEIETQRYLFASG